MSPGHHQVASLWGLDKAYADDLVMTSLFHAHHAHHLAPQRHVLHAGVGAEISGGCAVCASWQTRAFIMAC